SSSTCRYRSGIVRTHFTAKSCTANKRARRLRPVISTSCVEKIRRRISASSPQSSDAVTRCWYGNTCAARSDVSIRRQAHAASRCQHVGADVAVRRSDFMGGLQRVIDARSGPGTHRAVTNVAREIASASERADEATPNAVSGCSGRQEVERELSLTTAHDRATQLRFVRRENLNAFPAARDRDVPLLRIRRCADGRIGKQDVIDSLALRTVGRYGVAAEELAIARRKHAAVVQSDRPVCLDLRYRDNFAIREFATIAREAVRLELNPIARRQRECSPLADVDTI